MAPARFLQRPCACQVDSSWSGDTAVLQPVIGEPDKRALKQVTARCEQQVAEQATACWCNRGAGQPSSVLEMARSLFLRLFWCLTIIGCWNTCTPVLIYDQREIRRAVLGTGSVPWLATVLTALRFNGLKYQRAILSMAKHLGTGPYSQRGKFGPCSTD
jgi:hypothetical protein